MARSSPRAVPLASAQLPAELFFVYLAAPLVLEPMLNTNVFSESPQQLLAEIAGNYIPWLAVPLAIHGCYRFVVPALVRRVRGLAGLLLMHLGTCALVAAAAGTLVYPLHRWATGGHLLPLAAYLRFLVGAMCMLVFPALLVQELRDRAHAAERAAMEGKQAALSAQLEALQSRTQPHFLFNVLNTIASLIRTDPGLAEKTIERLATIMRHALAGLRAGGVPVEAELAMIEAYLQVQQARFAPRLRYTMDVAPGLAGAATIAPFLLQPLVENAVLHGLDDCPDGVTVDIAVSRNGDHLLFEIDDDGPGPGASRHRGNGQSLADLRARLALVYGGSASLGARRNQAGGYSALLTLPAVMPSEERR